jgi:hypothetical protein
MPKQKIFIRRVMMQVFTGFFGDRRKVCFSLFDESALSA